LLAAYFETHADPTDLHAALKRRNLV